MEMWRRCSEVHKYTRKHVHTYTRLIFRVSSAVGLLTARTLPHLHCTERSAVQVWRAVPGVQLLANFDIGLGNPASASFDALPEVELPAAQESDESLQ